MAEPQPSERDRAKVVLDALSRFGPGLTEYDRVTFIMGVIRQARAEGRREAIEECARKLNELLRYGCLPNPEAVIMAVRALLTEPGDDR